MVELRGVWTDYGGVLTAPVAETLAEFCSAAGVAVVDYLAALTDVAADFGTTDVMAPLDTPLTSQEDWERRVERAAARRGIQLDMTDFVARWFANRSTNDALLDWLGELREAGVFVGLLSNMPPAWDVAWRQTVDPARFDAIVLSGAVGARKPQRAIFEHAAATAGVAAATCALIDDMPANCRGAEAAGWSAFQYTDSADIPAIATRVGELLPAEAVPIR